MLARLQPEFPDLTPSKLRFLEEQRLVSPARTESGYRKFSPADLERLRFVLSMQRDHYLPLKVIRGYLERLDAGRDAGAARRRDRRRPSMLAGERRYRATSSSARPGATAMLLDDAVSASLIAAGRALRRRRARGAARRSSSCSASASSRGTCAGFRAAAERELGLIESALIPVARRKDASSRAKARGARARDRRAARDRAHRASIRSALARARPTA